MSQRTLIEKLKHWNMGYFDERYDFSGNSDVGNCTIVT